MDNQRDFKLIEGSFTTEEASDLLGALFNYKIDYHCRQDFSNHIRFNQDIGYSKNRIVELIKSKEAIEQIIENSKANNENLIIQGTISIRTEK